MLGQTGVPPQSSNGCDRIPHAQQKDFVGGIRKREGARVPLASSSRDLVKLLLQAAVVFERDSEPITDLEDTLE